MMREQVPCFYCNNSNVSILCITAKSGQGKRTLLLEARDRIGGRTWSAEVDGTTFEMGGTWISHVHGRLFVELQRYGLKDEVSMTRTDNGGASYFTLDTGSGSRKLSLEEAGACIVLLILFHRIS